MILVGLAVPVVAVAGHLVLALFILIPFGTIRRRARPA